VCNYRAVSCATPTQHQNAVHTERWDDDDDDDNNNNNNNNNMPKEQKECCRGSKGCKDQLIISTAL
jgi:hypothetical protein